MIQVLLFFCIQSEKSLGIALGLPEESAYVLLAQNETGAKIPKCRPDRCSDLTLNDSPMRSQFRIETTMGAHTPVCLEANCGLKLSEMDGKKSV